MQSPDFLSVFIAPLEQAKIQYFVTGSVATILYGDPRLTHDIDVVIHLTDNEIETFASLFPEEDYYIPPKEVIRIETKRETGGHFNLIHHQTGLKADIYPDANDPFHKWALRHVRRMEVRPQFSINIAPPEYVIIRKLEYYREGGSDKHLKDIASVIAVSGHILDQKFLTSEIENRSLQRPWSKVRGSF